MEECKANNGTYEVITVSHFADRRNDIFTTSSLEEAKCERDRLIDMAEEYNYASVKIVQVVSHHWREDDEDEWDQSDDAVDEFYAEGIKKLWNQC